jgi:hypothetical protein
MAITLKQSIMHAVHLNSSMHHTDMVGSVRHALHHLCTVDCGCIALSVVGVDAGCARAAQSLDSLAACTSLKYLCLSGCSISTFPPSIAPLSALTTLLLSDNGISDIPTAPLATLTNLEELDIRNNSLTQLPPQLALMPRLRSLSVEGNMLRTVRRTVLERGTPALLEYLRSRLPA